MNKKIIFSGGGTGGHIFPAINLMKHFFDKKYKVLLVTDKRGNKFIKNYSEFKSYTLRAGTPTNKNLLKKFFSYFLIFYSIIRSIIILISCQRVTSTSIIRRNSSIKKFSGVLNQVCMKMLVHLEIE